MRIDAHAHVIPDAYRHELDRRQLLDFPLPPASAEGLAAMLERHAIDGAIVSPSPPGVAFGDQPLADHLARLLNEKLSAVRRDLPQCVGALAILPLPDVERALTELAYALDVLKLDGVMLLSNVLGTYLGDPALDPLMAELDRRATHVFIHPQQPPYAPPLGEHPVWLYEYPFDTTRAVVNLIYSGTLERYPQITFQLSHLGGAAPYLGHRIASLATRVPAAGAAAPLGALAYLERLQYDTGLADNAIQLAAMRLVAPARQILFGTDWPYAPLPAAGDPQPALAAFGDDRAAVDAGNVLRLLPTLAAPPAR